MNNNLREVAETISKLTEDLIKIVEIDDYSNLDSTLKKRQEAIDFLRNLKCSKEEYKEAEKEFEVNKLQEKLFKLMDEKRKKLKKKLYDLSKNRTIVNSYNHNNFSASKIFSKKI